MSTPDEHARAVEQMREYVLWTIQTPLRKLSKAEMRRRGFAAIKHCPMPTELRAYIEAGLRAQGRTEELEQFRRRARASREQR